MELLAFEQAPGGGVLGTGDRGNPADSRLLRHLAADALNWCAASRADPLPLERLREQFLPESRFRGRETRSCSTQ